MDYHAAKICTKKEKGYKRMTLDWDKIKENLTAMNVSFVDCSPSESLEGFIKECGYVVHPMIVNLKDLEMVNSDTGVIVTSVNENVNNGVYIFSILEDGSLALVTVIPSTVSKGPLIRKLSGDYTEALMGVATEPLTPFDLIEVTGQVLANTVMKHIMASFNIPKEKEQDFISVYLPKFLANVAMHYTGASKDSKPIVNEEIADMEPALVRQMILGNELPEFFKKGTDDVREDA